MTLALVATGLAGFGMYLCTSSLRGTSNSSTSSLERYRNRIDDVLNRAGVLPRDRKRFVLNVAGVALVGALFGWLMFGALLPAIGVAVFAATFPIASINNKQRALQSQSAAAWPQLLEEMRLLCASLGRPIPQALIEVSRNAPAAMRPAFEAAEREWRITTDFERMTAVLREHLADPTADNVCETLLIAHSLGGSDLQRRLRALAQDRQEDLDARRDASSKQAGVRFARKFVIVVPIGMALAGMSIGTGRGAYSSAGGQIGVLVAIAALGLCWWWAGRLIRLPEAERVFRD